MVEMRLNVHLVNMRNQTNGLRSPVYEFLCMRAFKITFKETCPKFLPYFQTFFKKIRFSLQNCLDFRPIR